MRARCFGGMGTASCDGVMAVGRECPESNLCGGQEASDKGLCWLCDAVWSLYVTVTEER